MSDAIEKIVCKGCGNEVPADEMNSSEYVEWEEPDHSAFEGQAFCGECGHPRWDVIRS